MRVPANLGERDKKENKKFNPEPIECPAGISKFSWKITA